MTNKRVLMIDDDQFSLSVVKEILTNLGYVVEIASTADAAAQLLAGQIPEAVIYNQDLEPEWGLAVVDGLRRSPDTADLPVILLSQNGSQFGPRVEGDGTATICFQKPIAIDPFVTLFTDLVNTAAPKE